MHSTQKESLTLGQRDCYSTLISGLSLTLERAPWAEWMFACRTSWFDPCIACSSPAGLSATPAYHTKSNGIWRWWHWTSCLEVATLSGREGREGIPQGLKVAQWQLPGGRNLLEDPGLWQKKITGDLTGGCCWALEKSCLYYSTASIFVSPVVYQVICRGTIRKSI